MSKYPRIVEDGKKPDPKMDGTPNYGKPCIVCSTNTRGYKVIQWNYFRGEDEDVRVCFACWDLPNEAIIDAARNKP